MDEQFLDIVCDLFGNEADVEAASLMNVPLTQVKGYLQDARYLEDEDHAMKQFMSGYAEETTDDTGEEAASMPLRLSQSALASVLNALNDAPAPKTKKTRNTSDDTPQPKPKRARVDAHAVSTVKEESPEIIADAVLHQEILAAAEPEEHEKKDDYKLVDNPNAVKLNKLGDLETEENDHVLLVRAGANIVTIEGNRVLKKGRRARRRNPETSQNSRIPAKTEKLGERVIWRPTEDFFNSLCTKLSELDFWLSFHVSRSTVEKMQEDMRPHYSTVDVEVYRKPNKTRKHKYLTPRRPIISLILVGLWMLKTTELIQAISSRFRLSKGSIHEVVAIFCKTMKATYGHMVKWPDADEILEIEAGFCQLAGLPDVAGVMGTMSQRIHLSYENTKYISNAPRPGDDPRFSRCSVKHFVVCDHQMRIRWMHVCSPGSLNQAQVLAETGLWEEICDSPEDVLPENAVLVGGPGFPLTEKLVRPMWPREYRLTPALRRLQRRLVAANTVAQNCLGYLRCRWSRLTCSNMRRIDRVGEIFRTCCILHNLALEVEGDQALDGLTAIEPEAGMEPAPVPCYTYDSHHGRRDRLAASLRKVDLAFRRGMHSVSD